LRNPWAKERYAGTWAEKEPVWTDEIKAEVDFDKHVGEHTFWMPIEDFTNNFAQFAVALTEDSWIASRKAVKLEKPKMSVTFNNPEK